jgi:hypothetical protein
VSQDVRDSADTYTFAANDNGRNASAPLNGTTAGASALRAAGAEDRRLVGSAVTQLVFDRFGHLLTEANGSGAAQKEYIWLDDVPVAIVDDTAAAPVLYFIHTDQFGTPQKLTGPGCRRLMRPGLAGFERRNRIAAIGDEIRYASVPLCRREHSSIEWRKRCVELQCCSVRLASSPWGWQRPPRRRRRRAGGVIPTGAKMPGANIRHANGPGVITNGASTTTGTPIIRALFAQAESPLRSSWPGLPRGIHEKPLVDPRAKPGEDD